jgi:alkaline phosphatase
MVRTTRWSVRFATGTAAAVVAIATSTAVVASSAPAVGAATTPAAAPSGDPDVDADATSGNGHGHGHGGRGDHGHGSRARNVIFIQGDGMGIAARELIRLATVGQDGELAMNRMDVTGLVHTDSADVEEAVTDSAAAATAYATGVRSYNGAIGVDVDGNSVPTLLEQARDAGKATGLVTTSQVTDATPAAFGSHVLDRSDQSEIARQYIEETRPDVILGGGEDFWLPAGTAGDWPDNPATDPTEQSKGTAGNLVERAQELGYTYVSDADGLAGAPSGPLLGLFANEEMFEHRNEGEGDLYEPSVPLKTMATKALDVLSQDEDGFFLLIEEEGIDEMEHHGNATLTVKAGAALDDTVAMALDFAVRTPGTLVLVIGDHEAGGLAIESVDEEDENGTGDQAEDTIPIANSDLSMTIDWSTGGHTGAAVPVTAEGPGADRLAGFIRNTDVHHAVQYALRLPRS